MGIAGVAPGKAATTGIVSGPVLQGAPSPTGRRRNQNGATVHQVAPPRSLKAERLGRDVLPQTVLNRVGRSLSPIVDSQLGEDA